MKNLGFHSSARIRRLGVTAFAIATTGVVSYPAVAGPTGGEVVQGTASIQRVTPTLTNVAQASDRAVINWQDFSVAADEAVNFQQPNADAAILNRVVGQDMSVIAGQIFANGHVYLINANGIAFSGTAYVDANGFVATTANVSDNAFMSGGSMAFNTPGQSDATISIAEGAQILAGGTSAAEAGLVAIVAPGVEHSGIIQANFGQVVIGGAETFTMDLNGDGLYSFALNGAVGTALANGAIVDVSGDIVAESGSVLIAASAASDLVGNAINLSGEIFATSAGTDAQGNVILNATCAAGAVGCGDVVVAADALVDVSGAQGGSVSVSGGSVEIEAGAELNAAGTDGGGTVAVAANGSGDSDSLSMAGNLFADGGTGAAGTVTLSALNGSDLDASGGISDEGTAGSGAVAFEGGASGGSYSVNTVVDTTGQTRYDYNGTGVLGIGASESPGNPSIGLDSINSALRGGSVVTVDTGGALNVNGLIDGRDTENATAVSADLDLLAAGDVTVSGACGVSSACGVVLADSDLTINSGGAVTMGAADGNAPSLLSTGDGSSGSDGSIDITSVGNVTIQDAVTSGLLSITTTNGDVLLTRDLGGPQGTQDDPTLGGLFIDARTPGTGAEVTLNGLKVGSQNIDVSGGNAGGQLRALNVNGQIESRGDVDLTASTVYLRRSIFAPGGDIEIRGVNSDNSLGQVLLDPTGPVESTLITGGIDAVIGREFTTIEPLALPSREITLSGISVTIEGDFDIAPRLRDFSARIIGSFPNGDDTELPIGPYNYPSEFDYDVDSGTFGDPEWFYVTLNVSSDTEILFRNGIASNRSIAVFGDDDGVLASAFRSQRTSTNTLSLVIEDGILDLAGMDANAKLVVHGLDFRNEATSIGPLIVAENDPITGNPQNPGVPGDPNNPTDPEFDPVQSIFDANPDANVFLIKRRTVAIMDDDGSEPPAAPGPADFAGGIDPSFGNSVPTPTGTPNPSGPTPVGGTPGGIDPQPQPEIPTGTAPDAVENPSRAGSDDDEDESSGSVGVFVGGEGVGSEADLGNDSQNNGAASDVFDTDHHVVASEDCVQTDELGDCIEPSSGNDYLNQGVFEGVASGVLR